MDNQMVSREESARAVKEAPVSNAVTRLESRIQQISEMIGDLENRLAPILVPQPKGTREGSVSPSANSQLTTILNVFADRLESAIAELKDIRSRIEV